MRDYDFVFNGTGEGSMRNIVLYIAAILSAVLFLQACSGSQSGQKKPEQQGTEQAAEAETGSESSTEHAVIHPAYLEVNTPDEEINCWGDSITEGYGSEEFSYPEVLERLTGIPTKNLGVGGEDSMQIMRRCRMYGSQSEDILVIQMGDNGGWRNMDDLIRQYLSMIRYAGTDRYIIVSSTDDPDDFDQIWGYTMEPVGLEDTLYEAKFREAFGDHLFIGRKYLIENGLSINGLEETEEDRERAEKGDISLQLRIPEIDNTHLNDAGYTALAWGIYEKGAELGYWQYRADGGEDE